MSRFPLTDPVLLRFGLTLAHFLWQGALLAACAAAALFVLRKAKPSARYLALLVVLAAMVACPIATFLRVLPPRPEDTARAAIARFAIQARAAQEQAAPSALAPRPALTPPTPPAVPLPERLVAPAVRSWEWLRPRLSWAVFAWALGVFLLSVRLLVRWRVLGVVRKEGQPLTEERWTEAFARLVETVQVSRPVHLLQSSLARVPTTLGWMRPVVLLPASALTGLTPRQLEAVIAHELAHIRRHDYLINLLQIMVETLLFYHPAVWWLSNRIRLEREQCCDDIAIAACGNARTYAGALMQLAHAQSMPLALAATDGLSTRLHRLAGLRTRSHALASWVAGIAPALTVAALLLAPRLPALAQPREQASAVPVGVPIPVCLAKGDQLLADISGDIVVWADFRNDPTCRDPWPIPESYDSDIYGYDLRTRREFSICTARGAQCAPAIDGHIVVWTDYRNDPDGRKTPGREDNADIYGYDLTTGREFPVATAGGSQVGPRISGDLVVWEDWRNDATTGGDIWGRSLAGGDEFPICSAPGNQYGPAVSGTMVVWLDFRNDPNQNWDWPLPPDENGDIYGRDLAGGPEVAICTSPFYQERPMISGKTVVWLDHRSASPGAKADNCDVYGYDLAQKREFSIATSLGEQTYPSISGNLVVWRDRRPGRPQLAVVKDLTTGEETPVAGNGPERPAISGRIVVWNAVESESRGSDIFAYRLPPSATEVAGLVAGGQAATSPRGKAKPTPTSGE